MGLKSWCDQKKTEEYWKEKLQRLKKILDLTSKINTSKRRIVISINLVRFPLSKEVGILISINTYNLRLIWVGGYSKSVFRVRACQNHLAMKRIW